jgi:hypothetical protein
MLRKSVAAVALATMTSLAGTSFLAHGAAAQTVELKYSVAFWLEICTMQDKLPCELYLQGVSDGLALSQGASGRRIICLPANYDMTEMIHLVSADLRRAVNQGKNDLPARVFVAAAFLRRFPCR